MFRNGLPLHFHERQLHHYQRQMYEAEQRLRASKTYTGPIKAATPGHVHCYFSRFPRRELLPDLDRHYWRPVVDDPLATTLSVSIRIRFTTRVWVMSGWENRLHYQKVRVPREATIRQLLHKMIATNQSTWAELQNFVLAVDGKGLDPTQTLQQAGLLTFRPNGSLPVVDAIEASSHLEYQDEIRPKDWNEEEITAEDEQNIHVKLMNSVPSSWAKPYRLRPYLRY